MIRSSLPRLDCRDVTIAHRPAAKPFFTRGDVVVVNDNLKHYRGELEIVLCDIPNDGERNLVGVIPEEEQILLDLVKPEYEFGFIL